MYAIFDAFFSFAGDNVRKFQPMYWILKIHGTIALEFKDFTEATRVFKKLKNFCEVRKFYTQKMHIYKQLAYIYQLQRSNQKSLNCYKRMLYLAWFNENYVSEI